MKPKLGIQMNRHHPFSRDLIFAAACNEGDGPLFDSSRHILGTNTSAPAWVGTPYGYGVDFDGSDDYVAFGEGYKLGSGDFTASILLKANADLSTATPRPFQHRGTGAGVAGWYTRLKRSGTDVLLADASIQDGTNSIDMGSSTDTGKDTDEWFLLSLIRDGTVGYVFIDGTQLVTDTDALLGSVDPPAGRELTIGAADAPTPAQHASIVVASAYIWQRVLQPEELRRIAGDPFVMWK